jgi:hypothetical protein
LTDFVLSFAALAQFFCTTRLPSPAAAEPAQLAQLAQLAALRWAARQDIIIRIICHAGLMVVHPAAQSRPEPLEWLAATPNRELFVMTRVVPNQSQALFKIQSARFADFIVSQVTVSDELKGADPREAQRTQGQACAARLEGDAQHQARKPRRRSRAARPAGGCCCKGARRRAGEPPCHRTRGR